MINIVYLVLVITGGSGMMATQNIPQANMKQCQINANYLKSQRPFGGGSTVAYCVVGVK